MIGVLLFIWIQFFVGPNKVEKEERMQQDPETHNFEKVLPYEDAYMGNASNIGNLFGALPLNQYRGTYEMDSELFSLVMNYNTSTLGYEDIVKRSVIYNTTAAFTLIGNLEEVEMHFQNKPYIVTRENVEKWFGTTLIDLKDPLIFKERVQDKLNGDISQWLKVYTEEETTAALRKK